MQNDASVLYGYRIRLTATLLMHQNSLPKQCDNGMNRTSWLWTVPFCTFILGYLLLYFMLHVEHLPAPSLVGKDLQQVLSLLSEANLNARIIGQKIDRDIPDGTIVGQTPQPGSSVRPNQSIYLVISSQPPPVLTPNLINTWAEQVKQALSPLNIRSRLVQVPSAYPAGQSIGQTPLPHAPVGDEPVIVYCAQKSRKAIIWPDLVHQPLEEVQAFLAHHQIKAHITRKNAQNRAGSHNGSVIIDQRPLAGSLLELDPEHPPVVQLEVA